MGLDHICVLERSLWLWGLEGWGGETGVQGTRNQDAAVVLAGEGVVKPGRGGSGGQREDMKSYLGSKIYRTSDWLYLGRGGGGAEDTSGL